MENFKIFSNPLFDLDEEIIATEVNLIQNEALESITSIPSRIDSFDAILNFDVSKCYIPNLSSPSPIPVEDSDSLIEEIDLFLTPDDLMPLGIETDDYDSEGDILFFEELLTDDSLSLPRH
ncbi:hypothetical protein Tco_0443001 [Tanacetum coccineum]